MEGLCRLKKIHRVAGCNVPDVAKQKFAFHYTWFSKKHV